jgi:chromosome segregation ATPase
MRWKESKLNDSIKSLQGIIKTSTAEGTKKVISELNKKHQKDLPIMEQELTEVSKRFGQKAKELKKAEEKVLAEKDQALKEKKELETLLTKSHDKLNMLKVAPIEGELPTLTKTGEPPLHRTFNEVSPAQAKVLNWLFVSIPLKFLQPISVLP